MSNHPEYFSEANRQKIRQGLAPIADNQWLDHHPEHRPWKFQKLEHHHVNHGSKAKALPWRAHRGAGNYKVWHLSPSRLKALRSVRGIIPVDITDITGYAAGRPNSFFMRLEGLLDPEVGTLYEDVFGDSGTGADYFIIREQNVSTHGNGSTTTTSVVDYYNGFRIEDGDYVPDESRFVGQGTFVETVGPNGETTSRAEYNGRLFINGKEIY